MCAVVSVVSDVADAAVDYIGSDIRGDVWNIENNTVIADSVVVDVNQVNIVNSLVLTNAGTINGRVNVCDGCDVYVQNTGNINAMFDATGDNSSVIQLVRNNADLNPLGVAGKYEIIVESANRVSWFGLRNMSGDADRIVLYNSVLDLDDGGARMFSAADAPDIELRGNVTLYAYDLSVFGNGPIMSNVYGDGTISIYSENTNPLYRVAARISDNALYVDVVRDTDYFKILQNDAGMFLNSIRVGNPDDKLIAALDRATTMSELESIMSRTVRMNPIRMMDAVRTFNMFEMIDVATFTNGVSVAPIFLYSDDFNASGVGADVSFDISRNLKIAASVYAATMDFTNDLDEYKIALYGGNVHIAYFYNSIFARGVAGATISKFDVGAVFDNGEIVLNPNGISMYAVADFGIGFAPLENFTVAPFVRVGADYAKILSASDLEIFTGAGADFIFNIADGYDIEYNYGIRISGDVSGRLDTSLRLGVTSIADRAGGNISLGIIYDNDTIGYKVGVGVGIKF